TMVRPSPVPAETVRIARLSRVWRFWQYPAAYLATQGFDDVTRGDVPPARRSTSELLTNPLVISCDTRYVARKLARKASARQPGPGDSVDRLCGTAVRPRDHPAPRGIHRSGRHRGDHLPDSGPPDARRPARGEVGRRRGASRSQVLSPDAAWREAAPRDE